MQAEKILFILMHSKQDWSSLYNLPLQQVDQFLNWLFINLDVDNQVEDLNEWIVKQIDTFTAG